MHQKGGQGQSFVSLTSQGPGWSRRPGLPGSSPGLAFHPDTVRGSPGKRPCSCCTDCLQCLTFYCYRFISLHSELPPLQILLFEANISGRVKSPKLVRDGLLTRLPSALTAQTTAG